jgi:hypothetical protein
MPLSKKGGAKKLCSAQTVEMNLKTLIIFAQVVGNQQTKILNQKPLL